MKRSKIFLGVTTCLLAVAGLAAAKKYGTGKTRFYCTASANPICVSASSTCVQTLSSKTGAIQCTIGFSQFGDDQHSLVYTQGTAGQACSSTNCKSQLFYTKL